MVSCSHMPGHLTRELSVSQGQFTLCAAPGMLCFSVYATSVVALWVSGPKGHM